MAIKMETVTRFYDECGKMISESEIITSVPGINEIEADGFRAAFDKLENTVLEATNETRQTAVSNLLKELSQKKQEP